MGNSAKEEREPIRLTFQSGGESQDSILRRIVINVLSEMGVTGVSQEDIENAVSSYMANHPIESITENEVTEIVADYISNHPTGVDASEVNALIADYMSKHPIDTLTGSEVNNIISEYMEEHPIEGVSEEQIAQSVNQYLEENPVAYKPYKNKRAVAFGTSITARCANFNDNGYLGKVKKILSLSVYDNEGYDGNPIAYGTKNGNGIGYKIEHTDITNYDLITIEGGTNDFKLNVEIGEVGEIGDSNFDKTTMCGALRSAIEYILSNNPTAKIVIVLDPQRNNGGYSTTTTNTVEKKLIDYLNAMTEIASLYGLPVCDWYRTSGINLYTLNAFTADGLHPNETGCKRLGEILASAIFNNVAVVSTNVATQGNPTEEVVTTFEVDGNTYDISKIVGYTYKMLMRLSNKYYLYASNYPFYIAKNDSNKEIVNGDAKRGLPRQDGTFTVGDMILIKENNYVLVDNDYYKGTNARELTQYVWTSHDICYYGTNTVAVAKSIPQ